MVVEGDRNDATTRETAKPPPLRRPRQLISLHRSDLGRRLELHSKMRVSTRNDSSVLLPPYLWNRSPGSDWLGETSEEWQKRTGPYCLHQYLFTMKCSLQTASYHTQRTVSSGAWVTHGRKVDARRYSIELAPDDATASRYPCETDIKLPFSLPGSIVAIWVPRAVILLENGKDK